MSEMWEDVRDFHTKFDLPQNEMPSMLEKEIHEFRLKFLKEELEEFEDAYKMNDTIKAFDALIDLVYVAMGTAYMMNLPWDAGWAHVQRANLSKIRARHRSDSTRNSKYDVVKPEGWVSPEQMLLAEVLTYQHAIMVRKSNATPKKYQQPMAINIDDEDGL